MYHSQSNAGLAKTGDYCSEAAECFAFAVLSTAKAKSFIFAFSAPLAKRAVNAQHILWTLWALVTEGSERESTLILPNRINVYDKYGNMSGFFGERYPESGHLVF
jgi:hypothetical protein